MKSIYGMIGMTIVISACGSRFGKEVDQSISSVSGPLSGYLTFPIYCQAVSPSYRGVVSERWAFLEWTIHDQSHGYLVEWKTNAGEQCFPRYYHDDLSGTYELGSTNLSGTKQIVIQEELPLTGKIDERLAANFKIEFDFSVRKYRLTNITVVGITRDAIETSNLIARSNMPNAAWHPFQ